MPLTTEQSRAVAEWFERVMADPLWQMWEQSIRESIDSASRAAMNSKTCNEWDRGFECGRLAIIDKPKQMVKRLHNEGTEE